MEFTKEEFRLGRVGYQAHDQAFYAKSGCSRDNGWAAAVRAILAAQPEPLILSASDGAGNAIARGMLNSAHARIAELESKNRIMEKGLRGILAEVSK